MNHSSAEDSKSTTIVTVVKCKRDGNEFRRAKSISQKKKEGSSKPSFDDRHRLK